MNRKPLQAIVGVGVMAGIAYFCHRAVKGYRSAAKAYDVALKAVDPQQVLQWNYARAASSLRNSYLWGNTQIMVLPGAGNDLPSMMFFPTQKISFPEFWKQISPQRIEELRNVADKIGFTLEQAREQILLGTVPTVPNPYPWEPWRLAYAAYAGASSLGLTLAGGATIYYLGDER